MIILKNSQEQEIDENHKILRFIDILSAEKTIGFAAHNQMNYSFHFGYLKTYKSIENHAGDKFEGTILVNTGDGKMGFDNTVNNALISSWTLADDTYDDAWQAFQTHSSALDPHNRIAVVSTIKKVREVILKVENICMQVFGDNYPSIYGESFEGPVIYYPASEGINQAHWDEITHVKHGINAKLIRTIFHKREVSEKGQNHSAQREYRYAIPLNGKRYLCAEKDLAMDAKSFVKSNFDIIAENSIHYIEKIFLKDSHPTIEAACYAAGIKVIKLKSEVPSTT